MQLHEFANGKVRIGSLEGWQHDGSFRITDDRGEAAMIRLSGGEKMLETVEFMKAGVQRGFHVHAGFHEMQYVVKGSLRLLAAENELSEIVDLTLHKGSLLHIDGGVAHGLVALEPSLVLVTGTGSDPFDDRVITEWLRKSV